jgi:DNA-binding NtrC family response regulator
MTRATEQPMTRPTALATDLSAATQRLLVVEDIDDSRVMLQQMLKHAVGLEVDAAADGKQALHMLTERPYSVVVTDLRMPSMDGMKLIEQIQLKRLPVTVLVTTGHGGVAEAVQAMRMGAYDFLTKPADPEHLTLLIKRALRERSLQDEVTALRHAMQGEHRFQNVLSKSPKMMDVFELIGNVASTASTVLINGETGTGKEQVARAIHQASAAYRSGAFVPVNCAALPETLLESELFGHEKGAFTGASGQRKGRFEQAHGGTLFLDEVGDVPMPMQVKLLRVLQERKVERLGSTDSIALDVRVVAATNRPLEKMVKDGTFREDLFYRLNVIRVELPPLRDRLEDVPLLAAHFAQKYARVNQSPPQFSPEAMQALMAYTWPGNVRQLENAVERACVTTRDGTIRPANLPPDLARTEPPAGKSVMQVDLSRPLPDQLAELTAAYEERYLRRALKKTRGHVGKCAKISGLSRRSITDKISLYRIDKTEFKGE